MILSLPRPNHAAMHESVPFGAALLKLVNSACFFEQSIESKWNPRSTKKESLFLTGALFFWIQLENNMRAHNVEWMRTSARVSTRCGSAPGEMSPSLGSRHAATRKPISAVLRQLGLMNLRSAAWVRARVWRWNRVASRVLQPASRTKTWTFQTSLHL
jgi:hypothetical protein